MDPIESIIFSLKKYDAQAGAGPFLGGCFFFFGGGGDFWSFIGISKNEFVGSCVTHLLVITTCMYW